MKKAFTLIELLVVIAIIAILAAILFPVFAQAKAAAKKTAALSSIKQTGTAVQIYLGDNDDVFPYGQDNGWYDTWVNSTAPYIKSVPLTRDPSDDKVTSRPGWPSWMRNDKNIYELSFAANGLIKWNGSANQMVGVMGMAQDWISGGFTTSSTSITQPSNTIALATRYGSASRQFPYFWLNNDGGSYWEDFGFCGGIPNAQRDGTPYTYNVSSTDYTPATLTGNKNNRFGCVSVGPYGDKAVFSMADSSARVMDPRQTNPSPNTGADYAEQRSKNMWDGYR